MDSARAFAFVTAVALASGAFVASATIPQAREARQASGGGVIAGTLVAADTGAAVRNARLVVTSDQISAPIVVVSDDEGTFAFADLAAGTYVLWAAKPGFVAASYGEKRAGSGRAGTPMVLADRQRMERLIFKIPRASVLSGVVLDEFGEPAQGAMVLARRYVIVAGRRTPAGGGVGDVDDRGMFRIASLPPGEYVVVVSTSSGLNRAFQAGSAARSSAGDNSPPPALFSLVPEVADNPRVGYVNTYFPSTTSMAAATVIALGVGEERSGIDIRLRRVTLSRVSGTVRDADGSAARGDVRLSAAPGPPGFDDLDVPFQSARLDDEGRFSFAGVAPGQYTIAARYRTADDRNASAARWGLQDIAVAGASVDGVALTLQNGLTVSGAVIADTGVLPPFTGGVVFTPSAETRFLAELASLHAGVGADGRFSSGNLAPGRYRVEFRSNVPELRLASAMFGGRDAVDFLLEVRPGESQTGLLTLTVRETELSGTVFSRANAPTRDFTVVVFSEDPRYWLPDNRRNQAATPDAQGRFAFSNLPPGSYRLAAVEDFDAVAGVDAVLIRQLAAAATAAVTIAAGERKVQELRVR